jgi:hypothetical protein
LYLTTHDRDVGESDSSKAAEEKQKKPLLTVDQAQAQLEEYLKRNGRPSILELSGISPDVFEGIHRQTQVDVSRFPGYENAR